MKIRTLIKGVVDNRGKTPPLSGSGHELIETPSLVGDNKYPDYSKVGKFVSEETFNYWFRSGHPKKGDILISTVGVNIGSLAIVSENRGCVAQNIIGLRPDPEKIDSDFLFYILNGPYMQRMFKNLDIGGAQPSLKVPHILDAELPFELPTLAYQKRISEILSACDDLIENNRQRIMILEEMGHSLYCEWFVYFRYPGHKSASLLNSSFGLIPKGWEVKPLGSLIMEQIGGGWGKESIDKKHTEPAWVIRGTDIPRARNCDVSEVPYRYHSSPNLKSRKLEVNDIVFEVSGGSKGQPVGRSLFVSKELLSTFGNDDLICASFCKKVRSNKEICIPEILFLSFLEGYESGEIEQFQVQSTGITNFKWTEYLFQTQRVVPPRILQEHFLEIVAPLLSQIGILGLQIQNLRQTRDLLLPRLLSGQILMDGKVTVA